MMVEHNRSQRSERQWLTDGLIGVADRLLRTSFGPHVQDRPTPAHEVDDGPLRPQERRHAARLMRVNHAGEVAAQALYHGQSATARRPAVRKAMERSAREESDHLAWCAARLDELGGRRSLLGPVWYAASFSIGALAGMAGDRWSLGFVAETERQVVRHLDDHLSRLPQRDERSRAILSQMRTDEAEHGERAHEAGGAELPETVQRMMAGVARIMTRTAYWI